MKILMVSTAILPSSSFKYFREYGGLEPICGSLAEGFCKAGHEVTMIACEGSQADGVKIIALPRGTPEEAMVASYKDILPEVDICCIHDWLKWAVILPIQEPDKYRKVKFQLFHHGVMQSRTPAPLEKPSWTGFSRKHAQHISFMLGQPCKYVWHGIDPDIYPLETVKDSYYLILNRLSPEKGVHEALAMLKRLKKPVIIAGDTKIIADQNYAKNILDQCDGMMVKMMPNVTLEQKVKLLQKARAIVHTPLYPWCLPAGQMVLTNPKAKPIEEITFNDKVFAADGKYHAVTGYNKRWYDGDLIQIYPSLLNNAPLSLTPEHRVLALKPTKCVKFAYSACTPKCHRCDATEPRKEQYRKAMEMMREGYSYLQIAKVLGICETTAYYWYRGLDSPRCLDRPYYKAYKPAWIKAQDLDEGDFLAVPIPSENGGYSGPPPRLVGYYLAEGYSTRDGIRLCFGKHETPLVQEVCGIIKGLGGNPSVYNKKTALEVSYCKASLVRLLREWCGLNAREKRIPQPIMTATDDVIIDFLKGLWNGDGCITHRNGYQVLSYSTASLTLASQLILLLGKMGILGALRQTSSPKAFNHGRPIYQVTVVGQYMQALSKLLNYTIDETERKKDWGFGFIYNGYLYYRVRKVEAKPFSGNVYNLDVEGNPSFLVNNAMAHNCEAFGLTMTESLACGTPVLALDNGGVTDIVKHGKTGFVAQDMEELATYVDRVDKIKPEDCRQRVLDFFTTEKMVTRHLSLIEQIVAGEGW